MHPENEERILKAIAEIEKAISALEQVDDLTEDEAVAIKEMKETRAILEGLLEKEQI